MKRVLLKDSIKEIKNTYKRFISILLMAFLGVGFFAGLRAASPDMIDTFNQFYEDNQVYDIQIVSTLGLTDEDIEELKKVNEVENVAGSFEKDGVIDIDNKEIVTKLITIGEINKPILIDGNMPQNDNECLVEDGFLKSNSKQIGDTVYIEIEDTIDVYGNKKSYLKNSEMKIVGTVQSPLYISRDRGTSKLGTGKVSYYMYIPKENVNANDAYTSIYLRTKNEEKYETSTQKYEDYIEEVKDNIEQIKDEREQSRKIQTLNGVETAKWYILDRNSNEGYVGFIQSTKSIAKISQVFPIVFFAVAALISLTSMTRMVEEQRTQIGTLKALGYNQLQIMNKYILYASLASILGGILGMCVGFATLPQIIWMLYMMMYQITPNAILSFNWKYGTIGLLLICICIIGATIYSAIRELKETPAALMRPKAPKAGNRVLLERVPFIWKHLNFSHKVTVRNIFRYKKRFLMTIIGIFGCTSLIVTGFGIKDSISVIIPNQFEKVFDYNMQVNLKDNLSADEKQSFIDELKNREEVKKIVETYMTSATAIKGDKQEDVQIIVPKDEFDGLININDLKTKQNLKLKDNEIYLTDKCAQLIGAKTGDTITLKDINNNEVEAKISNIVENYVSHYVYMSKTMYENLYGKDYSTNVILSKNIEMTDEAEDEFVTELMNKNEVSSANRISTILGALDDTIKSLDFVVIILIVSAGLLAFVVLYNLANVNISERIRELATIKVLGFYDKEVYDYVGRETTILTIIGILLGLIAGYFLEMFILKTCELDILMFDTRISIWSYVYSASLTILFTLIVSVVTYFALKKIDMIESLKSVE